nr:heavy metal-associated isoprenylated plant protein 3-like [Ipomoea batatas]
MLNSTPSIYLLSLETEVFTSVTLSKTIKPIQLKMMKIVLKLESLDDKIAQKVMKKVSELYGVESMSVDKNKKLLTVTGIIDPVLLVAKLRKAPAPAELSHSCITRRTLISSITTISNSTRPLLPHIITPTEHWTTLHMVAVLFPNFSSFIVDFLSLYISLSPSLSLSLSLSLSIYIYIYIYIYI